MISDVELDRILRVFVAEGGDRAPQGDVEAALEEIAVTPQHRPAPWGRGIVTQPRSLRLVLVGILLILAVGIAVGVGAILYRAPDSPPDDIPPAPSPAIVDSSVPLVSFADEDWAVTLKIPAGWGVIGERFSDYRHFGGREPEGHLSVTNENPYGTAVCQPECVDFDVPVTIPYDLAAQIAGLKASVGKIAGGDDWTNLAADLLPDLQGGARLDTTIVSPDGTEWRRVHIVGVKARNVVAIAWSQPVAVYDESLLEAILDGIVLKDAPVYSDGDLIPYDGTAFTMSVPGMWLDEDQPTLDGRALSGVRRLGQGRVIVSIGEPDGTFGWCGAGCRRFADVTTLDALEAAVRDVAELGPTTSATLDAHAARSMTVDSSIARRVVIAIHDKRPVGILLDAGDWDVAPGIFDRMFSSFAFAEVVAVEPDQFLTTAGGRVRLGLSSTWHQSGSVNDRIEKGDGRTTVMTVRAGDDDGSITTCDLPAGPWELCREITPASLDELADAVQPEPIADHGVGPPTGRRDATTLGGEPAVITRIEAYEYPAHGGQEVVYIVAMHDGRPYIVRMHTSASQIGGVDLVIAGFTFVD